jgi:predicted nucleotide-binding protein
MKTCFVSVPFGRKPRWDGFVQDFDAVYREGIKPALEELGYTPRRADELGGSAVIHKAQWAAVMNSEAMIADVTGTNPNVLYELGLRHAVNPSPTVVIFSDRLPYDLTGIYAVHYDFAGEAPTADEAVALQGKIKEALGSVGLEYDRYRSPLHDLFPELRVDRPRQPCVFIGHGRSKLWARVQLFLQEELHLETVSYESESRVGLSIVPILETMLSQATFAVLLLSGEDQTAEGERRARQNVVHEVGLFQGHLGFQRVVMLLQSGLEEFSNVAGLQYIQFQGESIEQTFWELQKALRREGLVK